MTTSSPRRPRARRGRAAVLAGTLLVVVAAAAAAWFLGGTQGGGPSFGPRASAPETAPAESARELVAEAAAPARTARSAEPSAPRTPARNDGVLRGTVSTPPGVPFPERWTLVVEPARLLHGRDAAVRRTLELDGSQHEFELRDLPLAGYAVSAQAPGMNVAPTEVLLVEGSSNVFVRLELGPAGFVDGSVLDEGGRPAEGVAVTLQQLPEGERLETRTGPDGTYVLSPVRDGHYRITFGNPEAPLLPPEEITFRAPSLRFPERLLPPVRTIRIRVTDELGLPIPDATVQGYGENGGTIDAVTDAAGEAVVTDLPPGPYRLRAHHDSGRQARSSFVLDEGRGEQLVQIVCKP